MKLSLNIPALLAILLFACDAPPGPVDRAINDPVPNEEMTLDAAPERDFSNSAKLFAQDVLKANMREHKFDLSKERNPPFLKMFCSAGLESISAYSNKNYPQRSEPFEYEHFTLFLATYDNTGNAEACFDQLKAGSQHEMDGPLDAEEEIREQVKLLTLGAKPGGLLIQNGRQVFSLVETCGGTPIGGKWPAYENKFLAYITDVGEEIEVLNADCGMNRYRIEKIIATR